ncbi:putative sporulation protein YtaF [Peptoniphilus harei]|uniref:manganese efflux pump MntP n=1 Tax=Peptoniphilus harei TaxID=54005 RepID=UPI000F6E5B02|nr:manganese efflux pump MntP family protein [Peptoniphilus harei]MDU6743581.1 manganese efflux pump MntP family protein [Peptoniphilus harei]QQE46395.1 manganese efflux pump [Peptoniphilus harei]VEJ33309.1 putative sporulation protein YtaF [Peptoniphilus harei]
MNFISVLLIGVGLSMDAFAAAICKGLAIKKNFLEKSLVIALFYGVFQGLMPLIGYFLGSIFAEKLQAIDHWIVFVLLGLIGLNMIREARDKTCPVEEDRLDIKNLFMLAIATSIDALAVGVSFAFLKIRISLAVLVIGLTTFIISFAGVQIGKFFGITLKDKAQVAGGVILILLGTKILVEHLGLLTL